MSPKYNHIIALSLIVGLLGTANAVPTTYSGSLTYPGGGGDGLLTVPSGQVWNSPETRLSWTVDNTTTPGMWHYSYTFTVPGAAISHMIIEVSDDDPGPAFTLAEAVNLSSSPAGWIGQKDVKLNTPLQGNPSMPADIYGIKVNSAVNATTVQINFDSRRDPVWGDFYAKCGSVAGEVNVAHNAGFLALDPLAAPANGSIEDHLLVPDTTIIPAPGAILLTTIGAGIVGWTRKRRTI